MELQVTLFKGDGTSESGVESLASLLLRAETSQAGTTSRSSNDEAAVSIRGVPVLAFDFFSLHALWQTLSSPAHYAGLILTSPRCVESLDNAFQQEAPADAQLMLQQLKEEWSQKTVFCVGPSTAAKFTAFAALNDDTPLPNVVLSPDGNAESLGHAILTEHEKCAIRLPLLYPCGTFKRDTLTTLLTAAKVPFECLTIYRTVQHPDLEKAVGALNTAMEEEPCSARVFVFYSPSGVQHAAPLLRHLSHPYVVAIGPTTKAALEEKVPPGKLYQCSTPTDEALAQVLRDIRTKIQKELN